MTLWQQEYRPTDSVLCINTELIKRQNTSETDLLHYIYSLMISDIHELYVKESWVKQVMIKIDLIADQAIKTVLLMQQNDIGGTV